MLAAGTAKDETLRRSQVKRIGQLRARHGAADPTPWAGFVLSGDALPPGK